MKKIFTFLVAFLTTVSGAVWAEENPSGTSDTNPYYLKSDDVLRITQNGTYYVKSNGTVTNSGIRIEGSEGILGIGATTPTPTIVLLGVDIQSGGSSIIIDHAEPTFIIHGENNIVSTEGSDAAIQVNTDARLKVSSESTGILDIVMPESNTRREMIAIGTRGTDDWANPIGLCGSVTLEGGTIKTNGYFGDFDSHGFRFQENAVVIVRDIEGFKHNSPDLRHGGLLYKGDVTVGEFHNATDDSDFTLNSPLPEPYKIEIRSGGVEVTIGKGQSLTESQVDLQGGTLNAYKVSYDLNKSVGSKTITVADEIPYGTYYCGNKTALLEGPNATNSEPSWHNLGWANNTSIMTATPDPVPGSVTEAANQITAKAIWAVNQWTTVQVATGGKMETPISLLYPSDITGISFEEEITGTLDTYGAKIAGTKVVAGEDGAGEANESPENVILKIKVNGNEVSDKTTIIPFKVNNDASDLSDEDVTKVTVTEELIYSGTTVDVEKLIPSVIVNELEVGVEPFDVKYSSDEAGQNLIDAPTNQGTYYVFIQAKKGDTNYQEASKPQQFKITPKAIITVTAEPEQIDVVIGSEESAFSSVKFSSTDIYETDKETVTIKATAPDASWKVPGTYSIVYSDFSLEGNELGNYTLDSGVTAKGKAKVSISGDEKPIDPGVPDEGEEDDDVIIRVNDWTVADGAYQHVYTGYDLSELLSSSLMAKQKREDGKDDWISIPADAVTDIEVISYNEETVSTDEVKNAGLYALKITLDASKAEGLLYDGEVSPLPVRITPRDLSINFPLDDITEEQIGKELDPNDLYWEDKTENVEDAGLVNPEEPTFSGYIRIAGTTNDAGNYDVYYKIGIEDEGKAGFLKINYIPTVSINGQEIQLGEEGETKLPGEGIEIDDNNNSGSGITTKRYQLYLANKDYNVKDAKEDYAAEGLELFSRHNKKYTNAGGSFTVWYEKDGVANAGGYRIFWSNRANGEYKEVKFDTVSEYFQIRNVQSDVYVKIYAADGFPVGNEEISAADYRAYAQPNKIVVITPQPTDVQIISMAGAVVATDKVTGQREFANLTEGVYIVRMGETVVKLQVRK